MLDAPVRATLAKEPTPPGELSPFDYPAPFVMDSSRALQLGYKFGDCDDWLDNLIRQHDLAFV